MALGFGIFMILVIFFGLIFVSYCVGHSNGYTKGYEDGLDYGNYLFQKYLQTRGRD